MIVQTQLGIWMEEQRLAKGLTKGKISEQIGINVGQYTSYVTGKSVPRGKTLAKIAAAFDKQMEDIQAMLAPVPQIVEVKEDEESEMDELFFGYDDTLVARISLLEAKLDYAVNLLEKIARS